jgi:hypothetical protein
MASDTPEEPQLDTSLPPFEQAEKFLSARADADIPELALGDVASHVLGKVLQRIQLPYIDGEPDDEWTQTKALLYLGTLAGRSTRVALWLLRAGYESEALVFKRRLDEIDGRIARVTDPEHGAQRARDWLSGKDKRASEVYVLSSEAWHLHSHVAHADYRAVEQHLVDRQDDGMNFFTLLPQRNPDKASIIAVTCAVSVRNAAQAIADFKGLGINGAEDFDAALEAAVKHWLVPPDDDGEDVS